MNDRPDLPDSQAPTDPASDHSFVGGIRDYAIFMLDVDGCVLSWNQGAERINGYTKQEILGKHFSCLHAPVEMATEISAHALNAAVTGGSYETNGWQLRKDGSEFWANAVIEPVLDSGGTLLGFAQITKDITARKNADDALLKSEQQFRVLVQGVTDYAIYMLDESGHVTSWNAGAQRIKGYYNDEVVGTHFSRFYTSEERLSGHPEATLRRAKESGSFEEEGWRVRKDGTRFLAHVLIDPILDSDGNLIGYAKVTRDITERRAAAAVLKKTEQALLHAQKLETIGKLTGGVAHDFNNLLQVISGNLQLLSREVIGNQRAELRVASAIAGVGRGEKLTRYLLAFGRRQALDPKVVNVARFVSGMEDMLRSSLGETIQIETIASGGLWNTLVDIAHFENALLNLSVNARDAMDGTGKLTIEIGNAFLDDAYARVHAEVSPGQYVMLAVTDTGVGMPPEVVAQAFEPFFSTKPEGRGTGLGLSMVYGFVKQSGGHIKIYSEVDHGTTVKVYMPRSLEIEDPRFVAEPQVVVGGSEVILVAEDDEEVCATVVAMLTDLGYQVLQANDAAGALTVIKSGIKIDLLFTDVVMPGTMRSPELARKARERLPDIAVLFTSGYTQNAIVHSGRLDVGVELLSKPYTREDLARKVRHVLASQSHQRKLSAQVVIAPTQDPIPLIARPQLKILLVEDDDLVRASTTDILEEFGHLVVGAPDAAKALRLLKTFAADVLLTDIGLAGVSGEVLARQAREIHETIGIVFVTGSNQEVDMADITLLRKPYEIATLAAILERHIKQ
jgi:PAS domain S-box-containing protein